MLEQANTPFPDAAWERVDAGLLAKMTLWRTDAGLYALTDDKVLDLGRQLPGYYGNEKPSELRPQTRERLRREAWELFKNTDLFFVKVSSLVSRCNLQHPQANEMSMTAFGSLVHGPKHPTLEAGQACCDISGAHRE